MKMLLKRANLTRRPIDQFQVFKITKFEFKGTVHYGILAKRTKLGPLNLPISPVYRPRASSPNLQR